MKFTNIKNLILLSLGLLVIIPQAALKANDIDLTLDTLVTMAQSQIFEIQGTLSEISSMMSDGHVNGITNKKDWW